MNVQQVVEAVVKPLRQRVNHMVSRAVLKLATDSSGIQAAQIGIMAGEIRELCERFQQYGFTSVPFAGAEVVVVFVGGNRAHPLITNVDDRRYRKKNLQPGESAQYSDEGDYILLKRGRIVEVNAGTKVRVIAPLAECTGNLDVTGTVNTAEHLKVDGTKVVGNQGAAVADSTPVVADVSTKLNLLLARVRDHGLIAS